MTPLYQDLSRFQMDDAARGAGRFKTQLWWLVQDFLVRPSPQCMFGWRRFWLRLFGAQIGENVLIRPTARITYPWKLKVGNHVWIGDHAELYNLDMITLEDHVVISQQSYLCAGTHDMEKIGFPLKTAPIYIEQEVWVALGALVMPGVRIGRGAVLAARSVVLRDVPAASVMAGVPARKIKKRALP